MRAARLPRVTQKGLYVPAPVVPETPIDGWSSTLSGWGARTFFEDFNTNASEGSFLQTYTNMDAYGTNFLTTWGKPSNQGGGNTGDHYGGNTNLSASNGNMVMRCYRSTVDGKCWGSAPLPKTPTYGQLYGRFAARWRVATTAPGWKTAWLLWPNSEVWPRDGEIDFPEGSVNSNIEAFMHWQNGSPSSQDHYGSGVAFGNGWHTTVLEWKANSCKFYLDDVLIGHSTSNVPNTPMHWVLQTENNLGGTQPTTPGTMIIEVDRIGVWAAP